MATCPCGGETYVQCCGPLHLGERRAETAEELMRSRYSAFALGNADYLVITWHPRTRPADLDATSINSDGRTWRSLEIIDVVDGGPDDTAGIVEFIARYDGGEQRERSTFQRRAGRWVYVDAV